MYRQWIGLLALSLFGWQTARAQQNQKNQLSRHSPVRPIPTQQARPDYAVTTLPARTTVSPEVESIIMGRVMITDSIHNLLPVADAYVSIEHAGEKWYAQTDSVGTYRLSLPTRKLTSPLTVRARTMEAARGQTTVDVSASTKSIIANDIIVDKPAPMKDITGGGIALIPTPSRWQKFKRKLFHTSANNPQKS